MKKHFVKFSLFAVLFSFAVIQMKAQEKKPDVTATDDKSEIPDMNSHNVMSGMMGKSETPVEISSLMKFVGSWQSDASLTTEGKTVKVNYWVNCKKTADGNGIIADEGFSSPDFGTMSGSNLAGFDPYDSKIKWFSVDNMGTAHEHTGEWVSPDHLFLEHDGMRDGKKYVEKMDFVFSGNDVLNFKLIGTLDGVQVEKGEGVFHKKM